MKISKYSSLLIFIFSFSTHAAEPLIGTQPPELIASEWINSEPLKLQVLKGKVVLIRWWTAPDCPFCKSSSVALNDWHEKFSKDGLQVIGMYHHKNDVVLTPTLVKGYAENFGFKFPIGIDTNWNTLNQWWLHEQRNWTSVSFLLDRQGVIQYIHPGGDYIKGDKDHTVLENKIIKLLSKN